METYFYSAKDNIFFPESLKETYEEGGTWPSNSVKLEEYEFKKLMDGQSTGKVITADKKGRPILSDRNVATQDDYIKQAESEKLIRMTDVNALIVPLQDAVDMGIAIDDEIASLKAWKTYRIMLNRIDTSLAPNIEWPEIPSV